MQLAIFINSAQYLHRHKSQRQFLAYANIKPRYIFKDDTNT